MNLSPYFTRKEAADFLRVHPRTLRKWAARGMGPTPIRISGRVMYICAGFMDHEEGRDPSCENCQNRNFCTTALL